MNASEVTRIGGCTLIRGDALEVLPTLETGSVGAVITDPPFGVREDQDWDNMDAREFSRFSMAWLSQAGRVAGELIAFCSAYGPFRQLVELLWPRVRVMVWDKPLGSQYAGASERGLWFAHEVILHAYTPERREYTTAKDGTVGAMIRRAREAKGLSRGAVDIAVRGRKTGLCYRWEENACLPTREQADILRPLLGLDAAFSEAMIEASASRNETIQAARAGASDNAARGRDVFSCRTETETVHPCQKPLGLMREIISRLTEPGDVILDPFMGSGTTGVACLQTGRRFIGIELDPAHYATACRRVAECDGVGGLFEPAGEGRAAA